MGVKNMSIIKCKMCGGGLIIHVSIKIVECMYRGSMQVILNRDDESKSSYIEC